MVKIFRIGLLKKMICILAHLLGMLFVLSEKLWIGSLWFGFLFPFLSKLLSLDWQRGMRYRQVGSFWVGVFKEIWNTFFADLGFKIEIIYFSLVGLRQIKWEVEKILRQIKWEVEMRFTTKGKFKKKHIWKCMLCFVMLGVLQGFLRFSVLL
jgi:hypothetical protein